MEDDQERPPSSKWRLLLLALPILWFVVSTAISRRIYRTLPPDEAAEAMDILLARHSWIIVAVGTALFLYASRSRRVPETNRATVLMLTAMELPQAVRYTWAPDGTPLALRLDLVISLIVIGVLLVSLAGPAATRVVWAGTYVVLLASVLSCVSLLLQ